MSYCEREYRRQQRSHAHITCLQTRQVCDLAHLRLLITRVDTVPLLMCGPLALETDQAAGHRAFVAGALVRHRRVANAINTQKGRLPGAITMMWLA